jgi:hypothetical protein
LELVGVRQVAMIERPCLWSGKRPTYVNAFTFGVIFNRRLGYDLMYLGTLARGAFKKNGPAK